MALVHNAIAIGICVESQWIRILIPSVGDGVRTSTRRTVHSGDCKLREYMDNIDRDSGTECGAASRPAQLKLVSDSAVLAGARGGSLENPTLSFLPICGFSKWSTLDEVVDGSFHA